jgi:hypothetical protein
VGGMMENYPDIGIHPFVRRQTADSRFSHWTLTDGELIFRIRNAWDCLKPGYRDGVVLVPVDPAGFFTSVVCLYPGDRLRGEFLPRCAGERPRISLTRDVPGARAPIKTPAVGVDIVLYRRDVLAEDGDTAEHEWSVISVNARPTSEDMPMAPGTLMANHFHEPGSNDGGTSTGLSDAEFVAMLRKSYFYWRDKASAE